MSPIYPGTGETWWEGTTAGLCRECPVQGTEFRTVNLEQAHHSWVDGEIWKIKFPQYKRGYPERRLCPPTHQSWLPYQSRDSHASPGTPSHPTPVFLESNSVPIPPCYPPLHQCSALPVRLKNWHVTKTGHQPPCGCQQPVLPPLCPAVSLSPLLWTCL